MAKGFLFHPEDKRQRPRRLRIDGRPGPLMGSGMKTLRRRAWQGFRLSAAGWLAIGIIVGCGSQPARDNVPPPPDPNAVQEDDIGAQTDEPAVPPADTGEVLEAPPEGEAPEATPDRR